MKEFDDLLEVARALNSPGGCPWDLKQTFFSLQPYVLEEAHEVVEAVDGQNDEEIVEELGDLLYVVIFYAKLAEKESRFSMEDILTTVKDKLIRRHPHVFGEEKASTAEDVARNWDLIKKSEKGKEQRKHALEGVPDELPLLAKAQKMVKVFVKEGLLPLSCVEDKEESDLCKELFSLVESAEKQGVDLEGAFRRYLAERRKAFLAAQRS